MDGCIDEWIGCKDSMYDLIQMIVWMSGMAGCDGRSWIVMLDESMDESIDGWMLGVTITFIKALAWYLW